MFAELAQPAKILPLKLPATSGIHNSLPPSPQKYIPASHSVPLTDKEKVLAMCQQEDVMPIEDFFSETSVQLNCCAAA